MDEGVLERVGCLERLGALGERPLDPDRIADVDESHHGPSVGERHRGVVDDAAAGPVEASGQARPALGQPGDAGGEGGPDRVVIARPPASADDVGDMRLVGGEEGAVDVEDRGEGRIVEPEAPVGAEHRHAFAQVIEGLALDAAQRGDLALQLQPLGDVLVDPGHAPLRVGIGDDAERLAVGQVPVLVASLGRAVDREQFRPPGAEIPLLRDAARDAEPVEHGVLVRPGVEEGRVEIEEAAIGGVVRLEPAVGAEDGDGSGELVEGAGVEVDLAAERRLGPLDRRHVDGDAAAAALRRDVDHVEDAALAGDDRRQALDEDRVGAMRRLDHAAAGAVDQFQAAGEHVGFVRRAHGLDIGGIGPEQLPLLVAEPDRHRRGSEHRAHRLDLGLEERVARLELGTDQRIAGKIAETDQRRRARGPPAHLDQAAGAGGDRKGEGLARLAQRLDGAVETPRGFRLEPGAEGEERGAVRRHAGLRRQGPGDDRRLAARLPCHQPLALVVEQRLGSFRRGLEVGGPGAERLGLGLGALPGAVERDGADDGEGDHAEHDDEGDDAWRIERHGKQPFGRLARRGEEEDCGQRRDGTESGAHRRRSAVMLSHASWPPSGVSRAREEMC